MKSPISLLFAFAMIALNAHAEQLRPPSVPLVACDPYFSIWAPADKLADADTVHWTGKPNRLTSLVRIDGKPFRLMGKEPTNFPALPQTNLEVLPTRTIYTFEGAGVKLTLTFLTAALPDDLMVYSRPVTYLTWTAHATDKKKHSVQIYFDASAEIAGNSGKEIVTHDSTHEVFLSASGPIQTALKVGTKQQPVLAKKGDDLRIDWGYLYVAAISDSAYYKFASCKMASTSDVRQNFGGMNDTNKVSDETTADTLLATINFTPFDVGTKPVSRHVILAYDDEFSIQYFKKNLRPYWRRNGDDAQALLRKAEKDYESLQKRCAKFDEELMAALTKAGGHEYARICALAYRQCVAANKVVADENGQPLMFPKENFSNGCIGTVDVIYPMAPQFLFFSPSLTKAMLVPIMDYAASPRWKWPFAPHDLGTYPLANGQVYGGGERTEQNQMPVEETGNMLIVLAALAQVEGNAHFCDKYWPVLDKWADYLKAKGFDPENQLCTDDFAGHLAHNVNLSAKAICGLGAYARLCEMRGQKEKARDLMQLAHEFAARWVSEADDGDHFRLAFDKPGTWSQKYNLVWDKILHLQLFPADALRKEMDFYKAHQNEYGLPLDSRKDYTKLDWTLWTATLTQDRNDFDALVAPVYKFLNESPIRVPMCDWYNTKTAKKSGFQARSVVGGVYLQMLYDQSTWKKWAKHDKTKLGTWAPLPTPPKVTEVIPTSRIEPAVWSYTTTQPSADWFSPDFDDSAWEKGPGSFGTKGTPNAAVHTKWNTSDIWLRRKIALPATPLHNPKLFVHHDEDVDIYVNGTLAATASGFTSDYELLDVRPAALPLLHPGANFTLSAHCHQTHGGQNIDVGIADVESVKH
jgi:hypothetical protein